MLCMYLSSIYFTQSLDTPQENSNIFPEEHIKYNSIIPHN